MATTSADCISLLFYAPNKNVIANVHSGWRGTEKGISKITVEKWWMNLNVIQKISFAVFVQA